MKECWGCKRKLPAFFFRKIPKHWYSRSDRLMSCRFCSFKYDTKYTRVKLDGKPFATLEPFTPTLKFKIKEFFTP